MKRDATDQLLLSDAIDETISKLDFRALSNQKVFLDTKYLKIKTPNGIQPVTNDYTVSSLRQQMAAAGCLLQESSEKADYIVEARVGALGADGHEMSYGIPASNALNTVASMVPTMPTLPAIPEISFAKKQDQKAVAKIGVFAYHRESKQPVWQSGISEGRSNSKDFWVLGAGPFQQGSIYEGTQLAGAKLKIPQLKNDGQDEHVAALYDEQILFKDPQLDFLKEKPDETEKVAVQTESDNETSESPVKGSKQIPTPDNSPWKVIQASAIEQLKTEDSKSGMPDPTPKKFTPPYKKRHFLKARPSHSISLLDRFRLLFPFTKKKSPEKLDQKYR